MHICGIYIYRHSSSFKFVDLLSTDNVDLLSTDNVDLLSTDNVDLLSTDNVIDLCYLCRYLFFCFQT